MSRRPSLQSSASPERAEHRLSVEHLEIGLVGAPDDRAHGDDPDPALLAVGERGEPIAGVNWADNEVFATGN